MGSRSIRMANGQSYKLRKQIKNREGQPEVYSYDDIPEFLKRQLATIISDGIGEYAYNKSDASEAWDVLYKLCDKNIEQFGLLKAGLNESPDEFISRFLTTSADADDILSVVEYAASILGWIASRNGNPSLKRKALAAIEEINPRFLEHSVGYQIENFKIVSFQNKLVHQEMIKPTLQFLNEEQYSKANEEFLLAFESYRHQKYKDAITAASRSFESLLKTICEKEEWPYQKSDRATDLIKNVIAKGILTEDFTKSLETYVAMLKTGLPELRNNKGPHGDAPTDHPVTEIMAQFAINLTASYILLIANSYRAYKANTTAHNHK